MNNIISLPKIGILRRKFLLECIINLNYQINNKTKNKNWMCIEYGNPHEIILDYINKYHIHNIYSHKDIDYEDVITTNKIISSINIDSTKYHEYWGQTLIHIDDLTINLDKEYPSCFKEFREIVTKKCKIRKIIDSYENVSK